MKLKNLNILVVDDEPFFREILTEEFAYHGANIQVAENGRDAFELVKKNNFDIIFSDVRMPGGDGIELLRNMQSINPMPLFFFSTGFSDLTPEEAYKLNVHTIFTKPYDLEDAIKTLSTAAKEKKLVA